MGDRAGAPLRWRGLEIEENRRPERCTQNDFLRLTGGHSHAPRGAKLGASYNRLVHTYCAAIRVCYVQWGGSNA
jgi:hypothetical protein